MGKLNLVISDTLDGVYVLDKLKQNYKRGEKQLVIVPENIALSYDVRVLEHLNIFGSFDIEVVSFSRLADLYLKKNRGVKIYNQQTQVMLIRKVIEENKDQLKHFSKAANFMGFANEVLKIINQIRFNDIAPIRIEEIKANLSKSFQDKAEDILLIYNKFMDELKDNCYDAISKLDAIIEAADKKEYVDRDIYICEFEYFNKKECDVISSLLKNQGIDRKFYIGMVESKDGNKHIYPNMQECIENIIDKVDVSVEKEYKIKNEIEDEFDVIRKYLFEYKTQDVWKESINKLQLCTASDPEQEIKNIAISIRQMINSSNVRYKDISIVCCDLDNYMATIQTIFDRYEIPYYLDKKSKLLEQNAIKSLMMALRVINNNFLQEDVIAYVKERFSGEYPNKANIFENYVLKYGINYENGFNKEWPFEDKYTNKYERDMANEIRLKFLDSISPLKNYRTAEDVKGCVSIIKEYLKESKIEEQCEKLAQRQEENNYIVDASISRQVYAKLQDILGQLEKILGDCKMKFSRFCEIFETTLSAEEISTVPMYIDRVYVGDLNKTYVKKSLLYIVGANEELFPKEVTEEGLLTKRDFDELKKNDIEWYPNLNNINAANKFKVLTILQKATDKLYISCPKSDLNGNQLAKSNVFGYLQSIFSQLKENSLGYIFNGISKDDAIKRLCSPKNALAELLELRQNVEYSLISYDDETIKSHMNFLYSLACDEMSKERVDEILDKKYELNEKVETDVDPFKNDHVSASIVEKYMKCPFMCFMDNVLKIKNREIAGEKKQDNGTIIHHIMECFFKEKDYKTIVEENRCKEYVEECLKNLLKDKKEYQYLNEPEFNLVKKSIIRISSRSMSIMVNKMRPCKFEPEELEYRFGDKEESAIKIVTPKGRELSLVGVIDRVDVCDDECIVIDYKTKKNIDFDFSTIFYGITSQPIIYLQVLMSAKKYLPAGAYYLLLNDYFIDHKHEDNRLKYIGLSNLECLNELDSSICKDNQKSNIFNFKLNSKGNIDSNTEKNNIQNDEMFKKICNYTIDLVKNAVKEIEEGYFLASPLDRKTTCTYCQYAGFCGIGDHVERARTIKPKTKVDYKSFFNER